MRIERELPIEQNQPQSRESQLLIPRLREQLAGGENIHEVIGGALKEHSTSLFIFQTALSEEGIGETGLINEDMIKLYDLRPIHKDEISSDILSEQFIEGFHVATSLYHQVIGASRLARWTPPQAGEPAVGSEGIQRKFDEAFSVSPFLKGRFSQELRDDFAADPSGITTFRKSVELEFKDHPHELEGARRVVEGARRLYEVLTLPVPAR